MKYIVKSFSVLWQHAFLHSEKLRIRTLGMQIECKHIDLSDLPSCHQANGTKNAKHIPIPSHQKNQTNHDNHHAQHSTQKISTQHTTNKKYPSTKQPNNNESRQKQKHSHH